MTPDLAAPWLTVVMPIHNGANILSATLASVAAEGTHGIEFLLLDSSDDDRCAVIAEHFAQSVNLRHIPCRDIKPWPIKTNIGVEMARAPHIAMLHQDDIWLPGHVEAVRANIADAPDADLHIAPAQLVDAQGRTIGHWSPPLRPGRHRGDAVIERLLVQNFIAIPTPVVRRDAWLAIGGMDAELWYTADWDLYLKLAAMSDVIVGKRATTAFRLHAGSLTMTGTRDTHAMREQLDIVLDRHAGNAGQRVKKRARASAAINSALACAASGEDGALWQALAALTKLGPADLWRYLRDSRLVERVLPRIRLRLSGHL